jgi:diadenosine tetraphosphate (Ap4A) HIT family hydrolase
MSSETGDKNGQTVTTTTTTTMMIFECRFKKHWKEYTEKEFAVIDEEREACKKSFTRDNKVEYALVCRACLKPNRLGAEKCTRCYFECNEWDIAKVSGNVFLDILEGRNKDTEILFRNERVAVFDDKFGVSQHHLDAIPIEAIQDVTFLGREHLPLLEEMLQSGLSVFYKRGLTEKGGEFENVKDLKQILVAGFNCPVSVKHLHLHLVLPPFTHRNCFDSWRWLSYQKVVRDLEQHGRVRLYQDFPNDQEVRKERERAHKINDLYINKLKEKEQQLQ